MSSREKINTAKLVKFLLNTNDSEFRMLRHMLYMATTIRDFILEFKITKEEFCTEVGITYEIYEQYIKGAWNFNMIEISHIQHFIIKKETEKAGNIDLMPLTNGDK